MRQEGIIYTLRSQNGGSSLHFRFVAGDDDSAIFEAIDFILFAASRYASLWAESAITLKNPLGVTLLNIPSPDPIGEDNGFW